MTYAKLNNKAVQPTLKKKKVAASKSSEVIYLHQDKAPREETIVVKLGTTRKLVLKKNIGQL